MKIKALFKSFELATLCYALIFSSLIPFFSAQAKNRKSKLTDLLEQSTLETKNVYDILSKDDFYFQTKDDFYFQNVFESNQNQDFKRALKTIDVKKLLDIAVYYFISHQEKDFFQYPNVKNFYFDFRKDFSITLKHAFDKKCTYRNSINSAKVKFDALAFYNGQPFGCLSPSEGLFKINQQDFLKRFDQFLGEFNQVIRSNSTSFSPLSLFISDAHAISQKGKAVLGLLGFSGLGLGMIGAGLALIFTGFGIAIASLAIVTGLITVGGSLYHLGKQKRR